MQSTSEFSACQAVQLGATGMLTTMGTQAIGMSIWGLGTPIVGAAMAGAIIPAVVGGFLVGRTVNCLSLLVGINPETSDKIGKISTIASALILATIGSLFIAAKMGASLTLAGFAILNLTSIAIGVPTVYLIITLYSLCCGNNQAKPTKPAPVTTWGELRKAHIHN